MEPDQLFRRWTLLIINLSQGSPSTIFSNQNTFFLPCKPEWQYKNIVAEIDIQIAPDWEGGA
jgi:hypothetical protein